jgi:hypothetical protein
LSGPSLVKLLSRHYVTDIALPLNASPPATVQPILVPQPSSSFNNMQICRQSCTPPPSSSPFPPPIISSYHMSRAAEPVLTSIPSPSSHHSRPREAWRTVIVRCRPEYLGPFVNPAAIAHHPIVCTIVSCCQTCPTFREIGKSGKQIREILQAENGGHEIIFLVRANDIYDQQGYINKIMKFEFFHKTGLTCLENRVALKTKVIGREGGGRRLDV